MADLANRYDLLGYECLTQLIHELQGRGRVPKFTMMAIDAAMAPCAVVHDPESKVSLGVHQRFGESGYSLAVSVRPVGQRLRTVELWDLAQPPLEKTLEGISDRFIRPKMAYLAHLLVPSHMPDDAPDYVYMGV